MAPLFTSASFPGVTRPVPVGLTAPPSGAGDPVNFNLSDGSSTQVFDNLETALKCLQFCVDRGQWMIQASDDLVVIAVSGQKLFVAEQTLVLQKLWASYSPCVVGGRTLFQHRTMSLMLSLDDAMRSVGFFKPSTTAWQGNFDLIAAGANLILVDWNYRASVASSSAGSQLNDCTPLIYDQTP